MIFVDLLKKHNAPFVWTECQCAVLTDALDFFGRAYCQIQEFLPWAQNL